MLVHSGSRPYRNRQGWLSPGTFRGCSSREARVVALLTCVVLPASASAAGWPTYRHDNHRSAVTAEQLRLPLTERWHYQPPAPPQPAWTGPAKWDAWAGIKGMRSMRDFDLAYSVTAVDDTVYFASSADDSVHCLAAATGRQRWTYTTDGPVRLPPTRSENRLYFGSDDGYAYCLTADRGTLVWKYRAGPTRRLIPCNGKFISVWPVRTGVLVDQGNAYFAASLFPWNPSYLCALDAATGRPKGDGRYQAVCRNVVLQGALLASDHHLYALQGRSAPLVFRRSDGKQLGVIGSSGGVYALLAPGSELIWGPGNKTGWLSVGRGETHDQIASIRGATRVVLAGGMAYFQKGKTLQALERQEYLTALAQRTALSGRQSALGKQLSKLDPDKDVDKRKKLTAELKLVEAKLKAAAAILSSCTRWTVPCECGHALILAGDLLFAGGNDLVVAYRTTDGRRLWSARVSGQAHELAVAEGRLFVSTDGGDIYCFAAEP